MSVIEGNAAHNASMSLVEDMRFKLTTAYDVKETVHAALVAISRGWTTEKQVRAQLSKTELRIFDAALRELAP
jgi:hypothetical protein